MKTKFCPRCKSTKIEMVMSGIFSLLECKKCGYRSSIFPEKEI